ncbi:MaoC family dehydratase [Microvirga terrestris]|uniref:MaoC family dehydratase n=1 Tax=Microvirga terrestris TaxID=2791024 RepID=A0ABS0HUQ4_9HYPH|nr:MaoC family dehydratase [Microvirga terrestris]MBF9197230.1 MaoC family dehydratase [Microvirga terrestris]
MRTFEDLPVGFAQTLGPLHVSKDDILAFAREYDAQPFHVDEVAAKDSFVGTLIASGWHTCSLNMRLVADGLLLDSSAMGAPGIEEVKWVRPVRPGDTLRSHVKVLESRISKSRPKLGLVQLHFDMVNHDDETVLTQTNWVMFATRDAEPFTGGALSTNTQSGSSNNLHRGIPPISSNAYFEDLVIGETEELGSYTFLPDDIIGFAKQYDPQPFHVDAEAAKNSLFGALCASGWHTASVWMKHMVGHRDRIRAYALAHGQRPARLGPSPGFSNLKWIKPVYAGDTIIYRTTVTAKRPSASRPEWGLVFHHNTGTNQNGEEVFAFDGMVFWERRG